MNKKTVQDIRKELFLLNKKLKGFNNVTNKNYRRKICYMISWLQFIPCKKRMLDNWSMPDMSDINKLNKKRLNK